MRVLYVTSACLTRNTSANMSHNGYVKGLIDNGCEVDIIMGKSSWGKEDKALPRWQGVNYYEFETKTLGEKLREKFRRISHQIESVSYANNVGTNTDKQDTHPKKKMQGIIKGFIRNMFLAFFKPDPLYPLDSAIFRSVQSFGNKLKYDLVISNSSPSASHKIVEILTRKKKISYDRWVQIWEDPWFYDLYGGHSQEILKEEHRLLQSTTEILYVSPLTMMYQKRHFPDCADKMGFVPLPFFEYEQKSVYTLTGDGLVFGYFGDYYSVTRNLQPFYEAMKRMPYETYINGDTDLQLPSTENIHVGGRVTLDVLAGIQERVTVLVHLCNLRGGQIPGKIYHYSATNKKILFILDGTDEEQQMLLDFFRPYNRYYFCRNTQEDILDAIIRMQSDTAISNEVVKDFEPANVVKRFL